MPPTKPFPSLLRVQQLEPHQFVLVTFPQLHFQAFLKTEQPFRQLNFFLLAGG